MSRVAQVARLGAASLARSNPASSGIPSYEDRSQASTPFVNVRAAHSAAQLADPEATAYSPSAATKLRKSFQMHIGANLQLPTRPPKQHSEVQAVPMAAQPLEQSARTDYFEGLPLRQWAERLGERVMPSVELVQEEHKRVKAAAAAKLKASANALQVPHVPHFLPFSHWAANSKSMQNTLVAADNPKQRQKARLSWYHPDDTMVPRDWFKGGLLADLLYYKPFGSST